MDTGSTVGSFGMIDNCNTYCIHVHCTVPDCDVCEQILSIVSVSLVEAHVRANA